MKAQPARHLRVVDENGAILDEHPELRALQDEVKGLERDVRAWIRRYEDLRRDKEAEARDSRHWPVAVIIFGVWQQMTGHGRCRFTADRFYLIEPFLARKEYGPRVCLRAVAGIAFDHFSVKRKNGSVRRFDEWERCFKDAASVEERANAAPERWWLEGPMPEAIDRIAGLLGNATAPRPKGRGADD